MRIQHNIMAMGAYRNYTNNVNAMKKNLEKLSSGYKINRAGDDAAGLAISEKMRAQITGLETAQKNAKDGISLVQTAEGALTEVHDMLNRMVSLATQSANGTYDNSTDRAQLQKEVQQLLDEIDRIADSSNFNGIKLLDGSMQQGGGGATINGIDRIIDKVLAAGEDPIDLTGERTILDSGSGSSQSTKFDVDLTGLKGAAAADTSTTGAGTTVKASTDATKTFNGTDPADATSASVTFTVDAANTKVGDAGGTQVAIDGTKSADDIKAATLANGGTLENNYTLYVNGNEVAWSDTTAIADGAEIKLVANAKGANANIATDINLTGQSGTPTVDPGKDQGGAPAATKTSYEFDLDISKLQGGQVISLGGVDLTLSAEAGSTTGAAGSLKFGGLSDADLATALKDTLDKTFTDFTATVTVGTAGQLSVKMEANTAGSAANKGEIRVETGTGDSPIGTVTYNKGADAGTATPAKMAQATFEDNALKTANLSKVGTQITIGDKTVTVVDDSATTVAADQIKAGDVATKLGDVFENLGVNVPGKITFADGSVTIVTDKSGELTETEMKALTDTKVEVKSVPDAVTAPKFKFDFKLGGEVLAKEIEVAEDASSEDIANAIFGALTDADTNTAGTQVTVNGANYTVTSANGKLSFELIDDPTADNIKGNFDWDAIAEEGKFKGNHTAGTTVTQQGQVGASNAIANTVFRIEKGDIKDGAQITVNGKTVTLAVGENSSVAFEDKSGNAVADVIDLTHLDANNITDAGLSDALGKIAAAFKDDEGFVVGVNDESNGDTHTGLTVHKREGNTTTYDTKEKLAGVFSMTTPGSGKSLTLQIGDTAEEFNQLKVDIKDMHAESLGLKGLDISTQEGAAAAINKIKDAINSVSDVRGTLGATQNRLDHTINNLSVMTENIQDAESTIRDTDVAAEMMEYTKNNILIQSAQAMLAQANQVPQGVLQLLQ